MNRLAPTDENAVKMVKIKYVYTTNLVFEDLNNFILEKYSALRTLIKIETFL